MIPQSVKMFIYRILPYLLHMSFSNFSFWKYPENSSKEKNEISIGRKYLQHQYNALTLKKYELLKLL